MFFLRISMFTYIITIERCVDTERKIFMEIAKLIRERRLELGLTMKQLVSCDKFTNTIYLTPSYFYVLARL